MNTYTAAITNAAGFVTEIFDTSTDYDTLIAKFEAFRTAHYEATKTWIGGFVTQETIKIRSAR